MGSTFYIIFVLVASLALSRGEYLHSSTDTGPWKFQLDKLKRKAISVWKFRIGTVEGYADSLARNAERSIEHIWKEGMKSVAETTSSIQSQLNQSVNVYNTFRDELAIQQSKLEQLARLDDEMALNPLKHLPLDQFVARYDRRNDIFEEVFVEERRGQFSLKDLEGELTRENKKITDEWIEKALESLGKEAPKITEALQNQIEESKQLYRKSLDKLQAEEQKITELLKSFEEDYVTKANEILDLDELKKSAAKKRRLAAAAGAARGETEAAARRLRGELARRLAPLQEGAARAEGELAAAARELRARAALYEELVVRKQNKLYADNLNDQTLRTVLECLEQGPEDNWELVLEQEDIKISKKVMSTPEDKRGGKYHCVKAEGILEVSPSQIRSLFDDPDRVKEYNPYFLEGRDLERIDDSTVVVWCSSPRAFPPFKPRDFCTLVHFRELSDGSHVVVNRAAEHPLAPRDPKYQRARVLLGGQIIAPVPGCPGAARFATVTQVDPGGFAPAWIVNQIATVGQRSFFKNVEKAARNTPVTEKFQRVSSSSSPSRISSTRGSTAAARLPQQEKRKRGVATS